MKRFSENNNNVLNKNYISIALKKAIRLTHAATKNNIYFELLNILLL